ncbi:MAG: adenylosuccinate lyase [Bdellovibrionales bacterium]
MIERYTRDEMGRIWDEENRFATMKKVEIAVAKVQARMKLIPRAAAVQIERRSKFQVQRIRELEQITKHDVAAFVQNLQESVGEAGKYIHFGLTSSDVLDTSLSLQIQQAGQLILEDLHDLQKTVKRMIKEHAETLCLGRTHGMAAEPTTFGYKLAGFYSELIRSEERVLQALESNRICKLSGAVGTFSSLPEDLEVKVAQDLGLRPEPFATQVIPRDRHAQIITALSFVMAALERWAIELRHLQRTEVGEVTEGFSRGQKGSSAMPHKKNPISSENITGLSRLLRGYLLASFENIALWHERDISHSSVERVIFPDSFALTDYALVRMRAILEGLFVNSKRMLENLERTQGLVYSSHLLLKLVEKGLTREQAYFHVQRLSHSLGGGDSLKRAVQKDPDVKKLLKPKEVEDLFQAKRYLKTIKARLRKLPDIKGARR